MNHWKFLRTTVMVLLLLTLGAGMWFVLWVTQFALLLVGGIPRPEACATAACVAEALCFLHWVWAADRR